MLDRIRRLTALFIAKARVKGSADQNGCAKKWRSLVNCRDAPLIIFERGFRLEQRWEGNIF